MGTVTYINASGVEQIDNVSTTIPADALETLQLALNIAGARATDAAPQTVTLSAGEFIIAASATGNGALEVPSNIILRGAGSTTIVKLAGSTNDDVTGVVRTKSGATQSDGTPVTTRNVTIQDLVIDGNKSGQTSGDVDGFYCGPKPGTSSVDDNITLTNVTVQNCSRYGFDPHEQTTNLTFTNCNATGNQDGFTIDYSSNVTLTDCNATGNLRHGFNIVTSSHDITLNDCTATGNGANGLTIQTGDNEARVWTQTINVWGGTYSDNTKAGILLTQASNVNIGRLNDPVIIEGNNEDGIRLQGVVDVYVNYDIIRRNGDNSTGSDAEIQIEGYLQDFDDGTGSAGSTAALNDLFIKSKNVNIDNCTIGETGTTHQATYGILHNDIDAGELHVGTNNTNNFAPPNDNTSYVYPAGQEPNPNNAPAYYFVITRGNDAISATAGTDVIAADSGNDVVSGMAGNDTLLGNDGNDSLNGGTGNDTLDGGFGFDSADFSGATSGVTVSLATAFAQAVGGGQGSDTLIAMENIVGSTYSDSLSGNSLANILTGNAGSDTLNGAGGTDIAVVGLVDVVGGWTFVLSPTGTSQVLPNGDTLVNIEAIDLTLGSGNDSVTGGIGSDTLRGDGGADALDGGAGADAMVGGTGNDTYTVDNAGDSITELLNEGYDTVNTTLNAYTLGANVERVNFTGTGSFVGTGNALANRFQGGTGNDRFVDNAGGADIFSGGGGVDYVDFRASSTGVVINLSTGVHGGAAAGDSYSGIERFWGSDTADDTLIGDTAKNWLYGFGGNDTLIGMPHADRLEGGNGNDTIDGGEDKDIVNGGQGNDTLTGGDDADQFEYVGAAFGQDTVTDFFDGVDKLKVFTGIADDVSDFTISGNGTTVVMLTLSAGNTITLNGAAAITITNADFSFY